MLVTSRGGTRVGKLQSHSATKAQHTAGAIFRQVRAQGRGEAERLIQRARDSASTSTTPHSSAQPTTNTE